MTTQTNSPGRFRILRQNPVTIKELRSRMRGRRAFIILTIYLMAMGGIITLIYLAYASATNRPFGPQARQAGKAVFGAVLGVEVFLVIFIAPAFTAGAITGEKERQTYDLLRTTLLPARWFVAGKLFSALSYVILLIIASIPLQSIAFLLGGLSPEELILSQLLILLGAVTFAMFGLYSSSRMRSTLASSVLTFGGALFLTIGLPILVFLFAGVTGPLLFGSASLSWVGEAALAYGGLSLAATNLPATLIVSEVFLIEENTLFFFEQSFSGRTFWLFSPWMLYMLLYSLIAWLLYRGTVRRVRRIAEE